MVSKVTRLMCKYLSRQSAVVSISRKSMDRRSFSLEKACKAFWAKVPYRPAGKCWEWVGYRRPSGHGQVRRNGKLQAAHRVSFEEANGPIPNGLCVRHTCDNPACVNQDHLVLGTQADNMEDMVIRGRSARGVKHGHAKLDDAAVRVIRAAVGAVSQRTLAVIHGVSRGAIGDVQRRRVWTHVS